MINKLLALLLRAILWFRYRIRINGLSNIKKKGTSGILFLPNHPALIEPIILASNIYTSFPVRALANESQVDRFFIRNLAHRINVLTIPDPGKKATESIKHIYTAIEKCIDALRNGDNLILYPAGRIYRQNREQIGANSAVEKIIQAIPDVRIVMVRTNGLWGSSFSWASGYRPLVSPALMKGLKAILLNGIFFTPRRTVNIDLVEPNDLPRSAGRKAINTYLENFFNQNIENNTYVPFTIWEPKGIKVLPEPDKASLKDAGINVSETIRRQVFKKLREITGIERITEQMSLVQDMGMDSLAIVELITWLETEYGHVNIEVDSLQIVNDVLLASCGAAVSMGEKTSQKVPSFWFNNPSVPEKPSHLKDMTIPAAFLYQARRQPEKAAIADQVSGVLTYRKMILAILLLKKQFARLPGDYIGIMLPASSAVTLVYLAVLFAGKIPVMVNWTLGKRNLLHVLDLLNVSNIITSSRVIQNIEAGAIDLSELKNRFVTLEDLRRQMKLQDKLTAYVKSYLSWSKLDHAAIKNTAVVLFTSGSESIPKAVPLTHKNLLTNVSDAYECFTISDKDSFLGILPPFHSFGLTVSVILPLSLGCRVVFYPNPTHGGPIADTIETYKLTILLGTPTFLKGILRAAQPEQLKSLRLVVSGAEKCPQNVYDKVAKICPQTKILEGYGVTECSPVISVNHENNPQHGTIGKVMSSLEYAIVDTNSGKAVTVGSEGLLLVRGDSVFSGYIKNDGSSPFTEFQGRIWYNTGDLVTEDAERTLTFSGRLKRFIKLGGEMVSLPAIEAVLENHLAEPDDEGPFLAVISTSVEDKPEIVLFCTRRITRESANQIIRNAGLSGLHNIRHIRIIDKLPLLGTGKVDYRELSQQLASSSNI